MINEATTQKDMDIGNYITNLWHSYADDIRAYIRTRVATDEVEDIVQVTFERFYIILWRDQQEQRERKITNIRAYLYSIARNASLDTYSRNKKRSTFTVSSDTTIDEEGHSIVELLPDHSQEEALLNVEQSIDLRPQLQQLPTGERTVLLLKYVYGLTNREVAETLDINPLHVNVLLRHARHHLQNEKRLQNEERLPKKPIDQTSSFNYSDTSPLSNYEHTPTAFRVASAIADLPDPYRTVLTLAILENRKYTQIAAIRHCPLGTVKGQVSRGMRRLRASLQPAQSPTPMPQQTLSATTPEIPHLDALPEHHRAILIQREIYNSSYTQIATHLQIPLSSVKKRLHRARIAYRAILDQQPHLPRTSSRRRNLPQEELLRLNHPAYHHFYEALHLAYIDHLSNDEIAKRLHRPVGTVKAHLARGIQLLTPITDTSEEQEH